MLDIFNDFDIFSIELLQDEIFKPLICDQYNDILKIYMISNKGRVYNIDSERFVSTRHIVLGENYYYRVNLKCDGSHNGMKKRVFSMHRLLMMVFKPTDNMEKLVINHIDGDKSNNDLSNLEWCTFSENTLHAYSTGLAPKIHGEDCAHTTISKKTAIKICELYMKSNYTKKEIANICGTTESVVKNITTHNSWNDISDVYDFSKRLSFRKSKNISISELEEICKYFSTCGKLQDESVRCYIYRVMDYFNFDSSNEKIYYTIRGMYDKKYYKKISSKYTF
mgnify:CR=1 FL=1